MPESFFYREKKKTELWLNNLPKATQILESKLRLTECELKAHSLNHKWN